MGRKAAEPKITLSVDYQKAIQAFIKTGEQTKDLKKALSALNDEVKKTAPVNAADKAFGSFEKTINRLAREMKGNGATTQLNQMQHALEKVGGVSKLTEVQVDNLRRKIQGLAAAGGSVPKELQGLMGGATGLGAAGNALAAGGGIGGALSAIGPGGAAAAGALAAVTAATGGLIAVTVSATSALMAKAEALTDLSASTKLSAEQLQVLKIGAEQAGGSMESAAGAIAIMQKNLLNAPEKFKALGLSVDELIRLDPVAAFEKVTKALGEIENPTIRNAAAMNIFKGSADDALRLIGTSFADVEAKARSLNQILSNEQVAAANKLKDKVEELERSWSALKDQGAAFVIESGLVEKALQGAALAMEFVTAAGGVAYGAVRLMGQAWLGLAFATAKAQQALTSPIDFAMGIESAGVQKARKELEAYTAESVKGGQAVLDMLGSARKLRAELGAEKPGKTTVMTPVRTYDPEAEAKAKAAAEAARKAAEELRKWSAEQRSKEEQEIREGYDKEIELGKKAGEEKRKQLSDEEKLTRELHEKAAADIQKTRDADAKLYGQARELSRETAEAKMSDLARVLSAIDAQRDAAIKAAEGEKDASQDAKDAVVDAANEKAEALKKAAEAADELEKKLRKIADVAAAFDKMQQLFGELIGIMDQLGVSAESGLYKAALAGEALSGAGRDAADAWGSFASGDYLGAAVSGLRAIGGVISAIKSVFSKPEHVKVMELVGRDYGVAISEGLAKKIAEDSKRLGDRVAATLKNLGAIIAEAGGVEKFGVDKSISKLRDLFSAIERGQITVKEAGETFDEVFAELIPHAIDKSTGLAKQSFLELIDLQRRAGMASKEVEGYLRGQSEAGLASLKLFLDNAQVTVPGAALAIGAALAKALDDGLRSGRPMHEVLGELQPMIDAFAEQLAAAGLSGGAAFEALQAKAALFADEITGPMLRGIAGLTGFMVAAYNQGLLTQESFAGLAAQVAATRQEMLDQGKTAAEVNAAMAPDLQRIWELQRRTGYAVDENTQKMLDEAEAAGTVGEHMMSAGDRMADSMERVADGIDTLLRGLGLIPAAAGKAADGMNDAFGGVRSPSGPAYIPGGAAPDYSGWAEPSYKGFSTGGAEEFARAGERIVAHGPEVIAPAGDHNSAVVRELASTLAELIGSGGPQVIQIPVQIDGEQVGLAVVTLQERGTPAGRRLDKAQRKAVGMRG